MDPLDLAPAPPRLLLTEAALCSWFGRAAPGDQITYHRGFLAPDVAADARGLSERERRELARVAARTRLLAAERLAHLVQRRHGPDDYTYVLIARPRPRTTGGALRRVLDWL